MTALKPRTRVRFVKKDLVRRPFASEELELPRAVELFGGSHHDSDHHFRRSLGGPLHRREPDELVLGDLHLRSAHIYQNAPAVEHMGVRIDLRPVRRDVLCGQRTGARDDRYPALAVELVRDRQIGLTATTLSGLSGMPVTEPLLEAGTFPDDGSGNYAERPDRACVEPRFYI